MNAWLRVSLAVVLAALLAVPGAAQAPARPPAVATPPRPATPPPDPNTPRPVQIQGVGRQAFERLGQIFGVKVRVDEQVSQRPIELRMDQADFITALRV